MVSDTSSTTTGSARTSGGRGFADKVDSLNDVGRNVGAAYSAGLAYLSAQGERLKVAARNLLLILVLAAIAAVIGGTVVVTASVLLVMGIAESISALLGNRPWAGDLITGVLFVAGVGLTGYLVVSKMAKAARLKTLAGHRKGNY